MNNNWQRDEALKFFWFVEAFILLDSLDPISLQTGSSLVLEKL